MSDKEDEHRRKKKQHVAKQFSRTCAPCAYVERNSERIDRERRFRRRSRPVTILTRLVIALQPQNRGLSTTAARETQLHVQLECVSLHPRLSESQRYLAGGPTVADGR